MALKKDVTLPSGFTANYTRIIQFDLNRVTQVCMAFVAIYRDKAARDSGAEPAGHRRFNFPGSSNPLTTEALAAESALDLIYEKIKTLPEYQGAEDV